MPLAAESAAKDADCCPDANWLAGGADECKGLMTCDATAKKCKCPTGKDWCPAANGGAGECMDTSPTPKLVDAAVCCWNSQCVSGICDPATNRCKCDAGKRATWGRAGRAGRLTADGPVEQPV